MIIIFDLDGTLINTISDLGQACNYALASCGFPTHKIEDYPRLVGNGVNKLIERALPEEHRNEETVLRLREYFVPYYDEHNCDFTRPYDGIPELLEALRRKGDEAMRLKGERWFLAVASNKYQAATEKIVAQLFPGIFDVVLGERVGVERKPNPQIVYDILSTLNIQHSTLNCLYIGDSLVDAETARAAGATLVLCTWGFGTREQMEGAKPDYLVDHPLEVLEVQEFRSLGVQEFRCSGV
ncbi:MAG: HAD family hydrolase [Paludibacteraceae bacterium]|nr:HAD family hydrolase [Paludibacteraceae bacterium]